VALLHRSSKQKQANNTLASERMQGKEFRILPLAQQLKTE